jgi:hypothetical protein
MNQSSAGSMMAVNSLCMLGNFRLMEVSRVTGLTAGLVIQTQEIRVHADEAVGEASHLPTLEHVFHWALRRQPRFTPADVIIQDEFTHDVIFGAPDGSALVFDTT